MRIRWWENRGLLSCREPGMWIGLLLLLLRRRRNKYRLQRLVLRIPPGLVRLR